MQAMGADVDDYWDDPREEPGMEEWAMHRMEEVDHMASGIMENR